MIDKCKRETFPHFCESRFLRFTQRFLLFGTFWVQRAGQSNQRFSKVDCRLAFVLILLGLFLYEGCRNYLKSKNWHIQRLVWDERFVWFFWLKIFRKDTVNSRNSGTRFRTGLATVSDFPRSSCFPKICPGKNFQFDLFQRTPWFFRKKFSLRVENAPVFCQSHVRALAY
jgi:hypothetical protein